MSNELKTEVQGGLSRHFHWRMPLSLYGSKAHTFVFPFSPFSYTMAAATQAGQERKEWWQRSDEICNVYGPPIGYGYGKLRTDATSGLLTCRLAWEHRRSTASLLDSFAIINISESELSFESFETRLTWPRTESWTHLNLITCDDREEALIKMITPDRKK